MTMVDDYITWTYKPVHVSLIQRSGDDVGIARAAWVSTKGERAEDEANGEKVAGLLGFLMRNRHGTPFEHNSMTFLVKAPIFVWREHMRHRIGVSYNEFSGRYGTYSAEFYEPEHSRIQVGKPGAYTFQPGSGEQDNAMHVSFRSSNRHAFKEYEIMLQAGVAREVARMVLPVNILSSVYVTFNARSLMNFLELRLDPQAMEEIRMLAQTYFAYFGQLFPITANLFDKNGRVAP